LLRRTQQYVPLKREIYISKSMVRLLRTQAAVELKCVGSNLFIASVT
jgi:hypothetical protein